MCDYGYKYLLNADYIIFIKILFISLDITNLSNQFDQIV